MLVLVLVEVVGFVWLARGFGSVLDLEMRHETFLQHVYIIYL